MAVRCRIRDDESVLNDSARETLGDPVPQASPPVGGGLDDGLRVIAELGQREVFGRRGENHVRRGEVRKPAVVGEDFLFELAERGYVEVCGDTARGAGDA